MNTALQIYGNREDVREIETRLEVLIVGGRALNPNERRALAQVAVAHGLDPFNGEAWIIPGSGPMIGIKGLRKLARRQLRREHGEASNFYINFFEIADPDQRKRYRNSSGEIVGPHGMVFLGADISPIGLEANDWQGLGVARFKSQVAEFESGSSAV